jgi:hypothetical protein
MINTECRRLPLAPSIARVTIAAICLSLPLGAACGATLQICRVFDLAAPPTNSLVVPVGSLFRDNGRLDDPLAAFGNDRWQLRLVTVSDAVIADLQQCVRVQVRVTSDSSVKSVSIAENRNFVYAGSDRLLDRPTESEELLTTKGRVLDQIP